MGTPHKHAEVIKAWADGEAIQIRVSHSVWSDWNCSTSPGWSPDNEYRIKPKEPRRFWINVYKEGPCILHTTYDFAALRGLQETIEVVEVIK